MRTRLKGQRMNARELIIENVRHNADNTVHLCPAVMEIIEEDRSIIVGLGVGVAARGSRIAPRARSGLRKFR